MRKIFAATALLCLIPCAALARPHHHVLASATSSMADSVSSASMSADANSAAVGGGAFFLTLIFAALGIGCIAFYFLPGIIASNNKHPSTTAIWLVNFFFGWSILGWLIALIWACTKPQAPIVHVTVPQTAEARPLSNEQAEVELASLERMKAQSLITEDEYKARRAKILGDAS